VAAACYCLVVWSVVAVVVVSAIDRVDAGHSVYERAVGPGIDSGIEGSEVGCMHILCSHKVQYLRIRGRTRRTRRTEQREKSQASSPHGEQRNLEAVGLQEV
jgi:hypothetical protein